MFFAIPHIKAPAAIKIYVQRKGKNTFVIILDFFVFSILTTNT